MQSEGSIPDGGWGWVIVTCSFLIHMFVVGTVYALSILYVAWLDQFGDGKGITSWIISLAVAVMFGIGPVPGSLSKRIGNRAVVMAGGAVMCLGFVLSYFAMNVYFLIVSIGVITGTGAGCCYLPSVSMVAMYFSSKRSVAMGVAASGLGAGAFCMAPFLHWIEDYYGWRGCMLILAGISLNMCVLGALMRPPEMAPHCGTCSPRKDGPLHAVNFSTLSKPKLTTGECSTPKSCDLDSEPYCEEICGDTWQEQYMGTCKRPNANMYSPLPTSETEMAIAHVAYFPAHPAVIQQHENSAKGGEKSAKRDLIVNKESQKYGGETKAKSDVLTETNSINDKHGHLPPSNVFIPRNKILCVAGDFSHKIGGSLEILPSATFLTVPPEKKYSSHGELRCGGAQGFLEPSQAPTLNDMQLMLAGSIGSILYIDHTWKDNSVLGVHRRNSVIVSPGSFTSLGSMPQEQEEIAEQEGKSYCSRLVTSFHVYIRLLQSGTFLAFGISNFLTNLSFFMPVLYMVDRALDSGIARAEAAMLISLYGAGNIFGKLFFGWLADRELLDRLLYYIASLSVCGTATCVSPLCGSSHELHSVYAFVFGCFIGAYVTLVPIVTVDLMGLSAVSESFGLLLCFMGVATAFGTPVAGWIFDWTGSYTISFILHGVFILLSAAMLIPLLVLKKRQKEQVA